MAGALRRVERALADRGSRYRRDVDVAELVRRARCSPSTVVERPEKPQPFIVPTISDVPPQGDAHLVMVDAPAAVGKSTFSRWLVHETSSHFIDLGQVHAGSHGFVGNLAAKGLQQQFERGELTVVIDSLDEGLIRSGFANYEAFFNDVADLLKRVSTAWPQECTRLVLLGRSDSIELTGLVLEIAGANFARVRLNYMGSEQATDTILAYAAQTTTSLQEEPARRAVDSFFHAAARALELDYDELWSTPVGRGFAGYPPVLRAVAEVVASNPQSALSAWEQPKKWRGAWHLLVETANRLLMREQIIVQDLVASAPEAAYSPEHQLRLLGLKLTGQEIDYCEGLVFDSAKDEEAFREAVEAHLPDHPFLAEGASAVFGSMVAAVALASGVSLRGAERSAGGYSRWPFMWRFYAEAVESSTPSPVDGASLGWLLASLWTGTENPGWTTISYASDGDVVFRVSGASEKDVGAAVAGDVVLRGIARTLEVDLPEEAMRFAPRANGSDATVFVIQDVCTVRARELTIDGQEVLIESGAVVTLDARRSESPLQRVTRRPAASLRVSSEIFRYPWTSAADVLAQSRGADLRDDVLIEFLTVVGQTLPEGGRPAFLDGAGRPLDDDQNFLTWPKAHREALGGLVRELLAAGMVSKARQPAHGPVPTFSYRPEGFQWSDFNEGVTLTDPPWDAVNWPRIARFL